MKLLYEVRCGRLLNWWCSNGKSFRGIYRLTSKHMQTATKLAIHRMCMSQEPWHYYRLTSFYVQAQGPKKESLSKAIFVSLIIRFFQLIFLVGIIFFFHNKSAGTVFWLIFSAKANRAMDGMVTTSESMCVHWSMQRRTKCRSVR